MGHQSITELMQIAEFYSMSDFFDDSNNRNLAPRDIVPSSSQARLLISEDQRQSITELMQVAEFYSMSEFLYDGSNRDPATRDIITNCNESTGDIVVSSSSQARLLISEDQHHAINKLMHIAEFYSMWEFFGAAIATQ